MFISLQAANFMAAGTQPENLLNGLGKLPTPFGEGERLRYEVNWKPLFVLPAFKAGELAFSIHRSEYLDRPTYTISARAFSEGMLSSAAGLEVRDYFESTIDREDFRSYRTLRQIRQNRRKRNLEVIFDYDRKHASVSEINLEVEPPETQLGKIEDLPGPIADFLSVFYVARLRPMEPGDEYLVHLSDIKDIKEVHLQVLHREKVKTAIGSFNTLKISTLGGLFSGGGDFRVWYSSDGLRIPVKFEADVKFGTVYGQIIRVETPRMSKSIIRVR